MKISDFDYDLPEEKIAIYPPEKRGDTHLLVLNKSTGKIEDKKYSDIVDYLSSDDVLVLNDTKVIKARMNAEKTTGGKVEIIILEKHGEVHDLKKQLVMYKGHIKAGDEIQIIGHDENRYTLVIKNILGNGVAEAESEFDLREITQDAGTVPIPPYLHRQSEKLDEERYQTIFAKFKGSVAAPTASLNFTDELKKKLIDKGVKICYVTLHVGLGTFLPVREDEVEKHNIHTEYFIIPEVTITSIRNAKKNGKSVVALGTTVTRTLEYSADFINNSDKVGIYSGEADIFIYPGYEFKVVDKLITNFHAPRSTVLLLANAFAGANNLRNAYEHALKNDYLFLSYGDSMIIA
ncbi:MAG: tRNA preQ1(34) S-adenosylmethionine ribosyltransferase-isomerase QueA [bacterium]